MNLIATKGDPWRPSREYCARVRNAYRLASDPNAQPRGSPWESIDDAQRMDVHAVLMGDDDAALASIIGDPSTHNLNYGMDPLAKFTCDHLLQAEAHRETLRSAITETLVPLAEVVGARLVYNPETGQPRPPLDDIEALLRDLDAALEVQISVPNPFPLEFGLATDRGVLGLKVPHAIYQAWALRNIARWAGGAKILEIGGGFGRTAYYARQLGLQDYTIVDIPLSIVAQASFLGASLGEGAVWMISDPPSSMPGRIRLLPPQHLHANPEAFDVAINVDSMTELLPDDSMAYLAFLRGHAKAFLSINHECNPHTVTDLARRAGLAGAVSRTLHSMRKGYVEELYLIRQLPPKRRRASALRASSIAAWLAGRAPRRM